LNVHTFLFKKFGHIKFKLTVQKQSKRKGTDSRILLEKQGSKKTKENQWSLVGFMKQPISDILPRKSATKVVQYQVFLLESKKQKTKTKENKNTVT
jgi:hypothetical protein